MSTDMQTFDAHPGKDLQNDIIIPLQKTHDVHFPFEEDDSQRILIFGKVCLLHWRLMDNEENMDTNDEYVQFDTESDGKWRNIKILLEIWQIINCPFYAVVNK